MNDPHPVRAEHRARVLFTTLLPAARLARVLGADLKTLERWLHLACFTELRDHGATLDETAEALGVSLRKVSQLSKRSKSNFFAPEREQTLPRRIEFLVWKRALTFGRIAQALPDVDAASVEQALDALVEQGRVSVDASGRRARYAATRDGSRLVSDGWVARIDGLRHLLTTVTDAVHARFFEARPDVAARSFARTLNLRVRPEDLPRLRALYEETIWPALEALDAASAADEDAVPISLALSWAPYGHTEALPTAPGEEDGQWEEE
ncbi:MAG: hypothetical protein KC583_10145 [Myxococcales bacterium]|nr:hypothetical protein [Myxococcales bacterium]